MCNVMHTVIYNVMHNVMFNVLMIALAIFHSAVLRPWPDLPIKLNIYQILHMPLLSIINDIYFKLILCF